MRCFRRSLSMVQRHRAARSTCKGAIETPKQQSTTRQKPTWISSCILDGTYARLKVWDRPAFGSEEKYVQAASPPSPHILEVGRQRRPNRTKAGYQEINDYLALETITAPSRSV